MPNQSKSSLNFALPGLLIVKMWQGMRKLTRR
jgi:hypothetical protein